MQSKVVHALINKTLLNKFQFPTQTPKGRQRKYPVFCEINETKLITLIELSVRTQNNGTLRTFRTK